MSRPQWGKLRQGAPWWAMPLVVPGVLLGALGFVLSVVMTDWWAVYFVGSVAMATVLFWIGEWGWGIFSLGGTAAVVVGAVREWKRS